MAQFIHLGRCLGAKTALGCKFKVIACHVRVAIDLERPVGATSQTHRRALEVAHRGIEVNRKHIGQIGTRSNGQRVAGLVGIVLTGNDGEVTFLAVLEPPLAIGHLCQFAQRHTMNGRDGQTSNARLE